jgi:hypothetical protein
MDSRHIASIIKTYKLNSPEPITRAIAGIVQLFSIYDKMLSTFCPNFLSLNQIKNLNYTKLTKIMLSVETM